MKRALLLLAVCLSLSVVGNAQTKKPVRKTTTTVKKAPVEPSANGKFKFNVKGFLCDIDQKDFVIVTAPGKSASDIKSSILSSLSDMYNTPSKVISTLGDNIINVNAYTSNAFEIHNINLPLYFKRYSLTYNIKIEIKDGKIKVNTPTFSNIKEEEISAYNYSVSDTHYLDTQHLYAALYEKEEQQAKVEALINSHITKIITGLSSNSDW